MESAVVFNYAMSIDGEEKAVLALLALESAIELEEDAVLDVAGIQGLNHLVLNAVVVALQVEGQVTAFADSARVRIELLKTIRLHFRAIYRVDHCGRNAFSKHFRILALTCLATIHQGVIQAVQDGVDLEASILSVQVVSFFTLNTGGSVKVG